MLSLTMEEIRACILFGPAHRVNLGSVSAWAIYHSLRMEGFVTRTWTVITDLADLEIRAMSS